jgi:hypothetical protein
VLIRFLDTRMGDRKATTRSYSCSCAGISSIAERSVHTELGRVDILKTLRNEKVQIEIENASVLKKFPLEVSHAGFVFRGNLPSKRYQRSVFFQQLSYLPPVGAHKLTSRPFRLF